MDQRGLKTSRGNSKVNTKEEVPVISASKFTGVIILYFQYTVIKTYYISRRKPPPSFPSLNGRFYCISQVSGGTHPL